jgi:hypothetical protein
VAVAVARSILPRKLIILGLFRFINLAPKRRHFFDARRATLSGSLRAPACQESAGHLRSREYPDNTFWATFYGFRAAFHKARSAGISERNYLERTHFEQVWVQF